MARPMTLNTASASATVVGAPRPAHRSKRKTSIRHRVGTVGLFVVVLLLFLRVLGPVSSKLRDDEAEDVFFLNNAWKYDPLSYREALQKTDLATSYAEQVLKLHAIRKIKHNRFRVAVLGLALYLLAVLLYGLSMLVGTVLAG